MIEEKIIKFSHYQFVIQEIILAFRSDSKFTDLENIKLFVAGKNNNENKSVGASISNNGSQIINYKNHINNVIK